MVRIVRITDEQVKLGEAGMMHNDTAALRDYAVESILAAVNTPRARQFAKLASRWALCATMSILGGCQFKGHSPSPSPPISAGNATSNESVWQPQPVRLHIYPSTRFARMNGHAILIADVQLLDEMGDAAKAAGRLRCELFAHTSGSGSQSLGQRLYRWNVNLLTLDDQEKYYDPITRGYLLRLKLDNLAVAHKSTVLRIIFMPPGGARLATQRDLPIKW